MHLLQKSLVWKMLILYLFFLLVNSFYSDFRKKNFCVYSKNFPQPHYLWPFTLFSIPPHLKKIICIPSPMSIFGKSYPHPKLWGLIKVPNMLHFKKVIFQKGKWILDHVPVWLLSCNLKMTSLTLAKSNSLHLNIDFTVMLVVNLTIRELKVIEICSLLGS